MLAEAAAEAMTQAQAEAQAVQAAEAQAVVLALLVRMEQLTLAEAAEADPIKVVEAVDLEL
jgi:hypothetical protein